MSDLTEKLSNYRYKRDLDDGTKFGVASCPVIGHGKLRGDKHPSLLVFRDKDNKEAFRFHCCAGCTKEEIHQTLEYTPPEDARVFMKKDLLVDSGNFEEWNKTDRKWETIYTEQRYKMANGDKYHKFTRWSPTAGKHVNNRPGNLRTFFGLAFLDSYLRLNYPEAHDPESKKAENLRECWIAPGFHKAKALQKLGIPALAVCGGEGKTTEKGVPAALNTRMRKHLQYYNISRVVIPMDKDEAGRKWANQTRDDLTEMGIQTRVVQTPVENHGSGADIIDHLAQGLTIDEMEEVEEIPYTRIHASLGTDSGTADVLRERLGHNVIYILGLPDGWRLWDGTRFAGGWTEVKSYAARVCREYFNELLGLGLNQRQINQARRLCSVSTVKAAMEILQADLSIRIQDVGDHCHKGLINAPNGIIDLDAKKVLPHCKSYKFTQILPFPYEPDATCPEWDKAFDFWFKDEATREYMKMGMGTFLIGQASRFFFQLHGVGKNGKTAFTKTMELMLDSGDEGYGTELTITAFIANKHEGGDAPHGHWNKMMLKRGVFSEEPRRSVLLDDGRIKALTGGSYNTERTLHQRTALKWRPQVTLCISTNHKLRIGDNSEGMWDRIRFVSFENRIPKEMEKQNVWEWFAENEGPGILARMVDAASELLRNHPHKLEPEIPEKMRLDTEEYRKSEDVIGLFLEDNVIEDQTGFITKQELYTRYTDWCRETGQSFKCTLPGLSRKLKDEKGWDFRDDKHCGKRGWKGVSLKSSPKPPWYPSIAS